MRRPRFNPWLGILFICRLVSAAIAASIICCTCSTYYLLQVQGCLSLFYHWSKNVYAVLHCRTEKTLSYIEAEILKKTLRQFRNKQSLNILRKESGQTKYRRYPRDRRRSLIVPKTKLPPPPAPTAAFYATPIVSPLSSRI